MGSSLHSPDLLAALREPICKKKERRGKRKNKRKGGKTAGEGKKERKGKGKDKKRRAQSDFLAKGGRDLKLRH